MKKKTLHSGEVLLEEFLKPMDMKPEQARHESRRAREKDQ